MNRDELLEQLYLVRRRLAVLIIDTAQQSVDQAALAALVTQRDRVVWTINRIIVDDLAATLTQIDDAVARITDAAKRLDELKSDADDLAAAINIAKDVVTVATGLLGALH